VTNGDSIQCKIKKEDAQFIYFFYNNRQNIEYTIIDKGVVSFYAKGYYKNEASTTNLKFEPHSYSTFSVNINIGYGYRLGKVPDVSGDFEKYIRGLKSGLTFEISPSFYFSENNGLGLHYIAIFAGNEDIIQGYGKMSDKIRITMIGPSWESRTAIPDTHNMMRGQLGLGYIHFKNKAFYYDEMIMRGGSIGLLGYFGVDFYNKTEKTALTLGLRAVLGSISKLKVEEKYNKSTTVDLDEPENLSHIDIVIGLKFSN
jgi:hypothetical protein